MTAIDENVKIDLDQMNEKFDSAWTSRQQLLETVLKYGPDNEDEILPQLFEQMGKLNDDKEALEGYIPGLKNMLKSDPDQKENLDTIKSAVEADTKMAELIQEYMNEKDMDHLKYEIARIFTQKLNTDIVDLQEIIQMKPEHLDNLEQNPEMSYPEFVKAVSGIIPTPAPKNQKLGIKPKNRFEEVKEDDFEYEDSEHEPYVEFIQIWKIE